MVCIHCGKELSYESKFCPYCGKKLEIEKVTAEESKEPIGETEISATESLKKTSEPEVATAEPEITGLEPDIPTSEPEISTGDPEVLIKKKKKLIPRIIVIVAASAAIVCAIIFGGQYVKTQKEEKFRTEMRHARRYLEDLKYEQAVVAYQAAIKIDPKNPKAYIGIADAYIAMGDYESAQDYLEDGYDRTKDKKIRNYLDDIEDALKTKTKLTGMVISEKSDTDAIGSTIAGASVELEKAYGKSRREETETDENGRYEFSDLGPGKYKMVIKADDYLEVEQLIDVYPGQEESYNPVIMMISDKLSGEGTASGCIIDALTGTGVGGLTLNIREGYNSTQGRTVAETKTDDWGYYTTPLLDAGYYTIEILDEREGITEPFLRSYINARVVGDRDTVQQNGSVSTKLIEGQVRIVLSWGATPADLDSHLFCILDNGQRHMNYYADRIFIDSEDSERIVDLDLDDTDSYGPETTTIYSKRPGEYIFGIYNFSHNNREQLKNSQAIVQVYLGNSAAPAYVFYVPQEDGYFWEVFRYDANRDRITPVNHMYEEYWDRNYLGN